MALLYIFYRIFLTGISFLLKATFLSTFFRKKWSRRLCVRIDTSPTAWRVAHSPPAGGSLATPKAKSRANKNGGMDSEISYETANSLLRAAQTPQFLRKFLSSISPAIFTCSQMFSADKNGGFMYNTCMWIVYALFSAITAAGVAIFAKLGLRQVDIVLATTIRAAIMAAFLTVVSLLLRKFDGFTPASWSGREWWLIVLAGMSGAVSWLFYFFALRSADASRVAALDRTSLVFVVLLAALFLGEQLKIKAIFGIVLMVIGALLMI